MPGLSRRDPIDAAPEQVPGPRTAIDEQLSQLSHAEQQEFWARKSAFKEEKGEAEALFSRFSQRFSGKLCLCCSMHRL